MTELEGRELDEKMAELMGCSVVWDGLAPFCNCKDEFGIIGRLHEQRDSHVPKLLAFYSTDIAPAMQVVLKIEELEPTATIRLSNGDGDSCDVDILTDMFCKLNTVHISLDGGLELLPLAICRAALMAAGDADRRLGYDDLDEFPEQTDEHMAAPR